MKKPQGMTLVDVIVGAFLLLVIFVALFALMRVSLQTAAVAKAKAGAVAVLTSHMEYVRGLPYDLVGTEGGIPQGSIAQVSTTTNSGFEYGVRTFIQYVDDPADGEEENDENAIVTDYKRVKIEVVYMLRDRERSVSLVSAVMPNGIETNAGGGTIRIEVLDEQGEGVSNAEVRVQNSLLVPEVDVITFSNAQGLVLFYGAATSTEYQITVDKSGFSSAKTYDRDSENTDPTPGHLTVAEGQTTTATFTIDALASLTLRTFAPGALPLPGVSYALVGAKTIGSTAEGEPLYKTTVSDTTDGAGVTTESLEYDVYSLSISGYDIINACPAAPYALLPGGSIDASLTLGPSSTNALLVSVYDQDGDVIPDATVTISRSGYSASHTSSSCGVAYFGSLVANDYTITIAKEGYATVAYPNVSVSGKTIYAASFE